MKFDIKAIVQILEDYDLCEIRYKEGDDSFHIVRKLPPPVTSFVPASQAAPAPAIAPLPSQPQAAAPQAPAAPAAPSVPENEESITSPIVGTAYLSPEPGAAPFVSVGSKVSKGQTVMIIEAMKVMNPLKSTVSGTVVAVLAHDGKPIEFGETLIRVRKD